MDQTADQARRLESVVRFGTIAEIDHAAARVRVKSGGLVSNWLPWLAWRAGRTSRWSPPTSGEQCIVLSPSGETAAGLVLVGIYSKAEPAPCASPDEEVCLYPDGARITYNHATGALSAIGIKSAVVQASDRCTVDCPESEFTGNVYIGGNLAVKGEAVIHGVLTYLAGLSGSGGAGGGTQISGPINHDGQLNNTGSISSNGIVLATHTHPGDSGGTTGGPQ